MIKQISLKKKLIVLLALSLMFGVVLASCSSDETSGNGGGNDSADEDVNNGSTSGEAEVELTMWLWTGMGVEEHIEQYEEENPHISIDVQTSEFGDMHTNLITALSSGSGAPDITGLEIQYVERFKESADHFYNLFDYGVEEIANDYLDWKWEQGMTPDGDHLIGIPTDIGPMAMAYRTDLFEEAGLPSDPDEIAAEISTWDDFLEAGKQLQDQTGVAMVNNISEIYTVIAHQSELMYFDEENELIVEENPQIERAWDLAIASHENGLSLNIEGSTTEKDAAMNNGDFAVEFTPAWNMQNIKDSAPDTEGLWGLAPMPEGGGNRGGSFFAVPTQSDHPEEAYEFLKWLFAPEQQLSIFELHGNFPSTPEVYEDPAFLEFTDDFFATPEVGQIFSSAAEDVIAQYQGPDHPTVNDAIGDAMGRVEDGVSTPEEAWQEAMEEIDRQLSR